MPREGFEDFGLTNAPGAIVAEVTPGGAAPKAGMEPGDVIVEYNGRRSATTTSSSRWWSRTKPGTSVPVKVLRNKQEKTLNVVVDELDLEAEQNAGRRAPQSDQPARRNRAPAASG